LRELREVSSEFQRGFSERGFSEPPSVAGNCTFSFPSSLIRRAGTSW
jgi:hypothetical protein